MSEEKIEKIDKEDKVDVNKKIDEAEAAMKSMPVRIL
jgi:hypothetical protein